MQYGARLRVTIEASNDNIWQKYLRPNDLMIALDKYIGGGKGEEVYQKSGFSAKQIIKQILKKLKV